MGMIIDRLMDERIMVVQSGSSEYEGRVKFQSFLSQIQLPIAQGPLLAVESLWDMGVLQPMRYLHSLALKAARNLLGRTFYTTQNILQKESFFEGDNLPSCLTLLFWFLGTNGCTTVYAAIPVTLWVWFQQGQQRSLGWAGDVGSPSEFLIPLQVCGFARSFPAWSHSSPLGRRQQLHSFVMAGPPEASPSQLCCIVSSLGSGRGSEGCFTLVYHQLPSWIFFKIYEPIENKTKERDIRGKGGC